MQSELGGRGGGALAWLAFASSPFPNSGKRAGLNRRHKPLCSCSSGVVYDGVYFIFGAPCACCIQNACLWWLFPQEVVPPLVGPSGLLGLHGAKGSVGSRRFVGDSRVNTSLVRVCEGGGGGGSSPSGSYLEFFVCFVTSRNISSKNGGFDEDIRPD